MTQRDSFNTDIADRWDLDLTPFSNDELLELIGELKEFLQD